MLKINNKLKNLMRDFMPRQYQVPVKYYYNQLNSTLEPEMEILEYLVSKNDRVIDVSGNRGIYAYKFWKLGLRIEIFEPIINCASVLSAWAIGKKNVNVYPVAMSSDTGHKNLYIPVDDSGIEHDASGSVESNRFTSSRDYMVNLDILDNYHFEDVTLIKIDVEGHEYSVIEGATETIKSMKPSLLIEIEQRHSNRPVLEMFTKIINFGYEGYFFDEGKLVSIDKFELTRDQNYQNMGNSTQKYINNFIFLHKSKSNDLKSDELIN